MVKPVTRKSSLAGAVGIMFVATLIWGVGNAVTGYSSSVGSSEPLANSLYIALANTLGGLTIIFLLLLVNRLRQGYAHSGPIRIIGGIARKSGYVKALNTFLFVLATAYISTASAVALESTFVLWTVWLHRQSIPSRLSAVAVLSTAVLLMAGVWLVCKPDIQSLESAPLGIGIGLGAGLAYSRFLKLWALNDDVTQRTENNIAQTYSMLVHSVGLLSLATLALIAALGILTSSMPKLISGFHFSVQFANGMAVIGIVYLLMRVGFSRLENLSISREIPAAFVLSFSIPIASLSEAIMKQRPMDGMAQWGLLCFLVSLPLLANLTKKRHA